MEHKLTDINESARTALCSVCGQTKIKLRDKKKSLSGRYRCKAVHNKKHYSYRIHKKDSCEHCGFVPVHSSQLDVDHINGNHQDNDLSNLQTLCANCHRLKTHLSGDSNSGIF